MTGFLEKHDMIQADKGFNISDECAARMIHLRVPPGKRGQAQMTKLACDKIGKISNLRINVEHVIARIKSVSPQECGTRLLSWTKYL